MDLQLAGKRALVTGGSRGIGKGVARQLALEGATCAICSRHQTDIERAAADLTAETGSPCLPFVADMIDLASIEGLVEQSVESLGGIDILVCCAARVSGGRPDDFAHVTDELIMNDFQEKYLGYFRCVRAVVPHMRRAGWGRIVMVSGLAARQAGNISAGARNASVVNLAKALSAEFGQSGITVNVVHPAGTMTERFQERMAAEAKAQGISQEEALRRASARNAIGRPVTVQEIADVVAFLASPRSAAVSGEAISASPAEPGRERSKPTQLANKPPPAWTSYRRRRSRISSS